MALTRTQLLRSIALSFAIYAGAAGLYILMPFPVLTAELAYAVLHYLVGLRYFIFGSEFPIEQYHLLHRLIMWVEGAVAVGLSLGAVLKPSRSYILFSFLLVLLLIAVSWSYQITML